MGLLAKIKLTFEYLVPTLQFGHIRFEKWKPLSKETYYAPCPAEGWAPPQAVNGRGWAGS